MADAARAVGRYFGTAADIPGTGEASDPYYMAVFNNSHNFNQVTPANIMKWVYLEPQQNVFDFSGADEFVALAEATDKIIRCHNLNWYNQLPTCKSNLSYSISRFSTTTKDSMLVHHSSGLILATDFLKHLLTFLLIASGITNPATPWNNETLMAALVNHIDNVMGHFGDSCCKHIDV
jgi:endo-1,4-beta-xylanase